MKATTNIQAAYSIMIKEEATPEAKYQQLKEGFRSIATKPVDKNVDELILFTITVALVRGFYAGRDQYFWQAVKFQYNSDHAVR